MAGITKRGNSYKIKVSCGYDATGKQIVKTTTWKPDSSMTEKQADKEAMHQAALFEERCRSGLVLDGNVRFKDFSDRWMEEHVARNLKQKTADRYKALLVRINAGIGHIHLNKLKPHHIMAFMKNLSEGGIREDGKYQAACDLCGVLKEMKLSKAELCRKANLAASTVDLAFQRKIVAHKTAAGISEALGRNDLFIPASKNEGKLSDRTQLHYYRLIHSILTDAVQWQAIPDNPCSRVKPPSAAQKEAKFLDDEQTAKLLEYMESEPFNLQVFIRMALYTGLRRGELLGLKWSDIDHKGSLLHIKRTLLYTKERGLYEDTPKNESSIRVLKLSAGMLETLQAYQAWYEAEQERHGDKWVNNDYMFTRWNGEPLRPDSISEWFRKFIAKTDLPAVSLHSLRHTSATLQIMKGIPLKAVSARLGHARESTTRDIYSHAIKSVDALAADALDEIIKPVTAIKVVK